MKHQVYRNIEEYEDILHLPHHVSNHRAQMPIPDRAAQFSPFSAVVGHETAIKEAARTTDKRRELDDMEKAIIDHKLREIESHLPEGFEIELIYFESDEVKAGGQYVTKIGKVRKIEPYHEVILMEDGTRIPIEQIYRINYQLFLSREF